MEMCHPDATEDDLTNIVVKIFYSELVHKVVRLEMLGGLLKNKETLRLKKKLFN